MPRLSLSLFGGFDAVFDGRPVAGPRSDKVRALLAYLAVEADRPHRRETLAGLLWPEFPDRAALNSLRSALANLRQALGDAQAATPFFQITREVIRFNADADSWLDVAELERGIANSEWRMASGKPQSPISSSKDLSGFRSPDRSLLEHQHLVGCDRPLAQPRHVAGLHAFDESFGSDPAGLEARRSGQPNHLRRMTAGFPMTFKLRIVTWNCNMALRLKFDRLRALRPDVAVIQECADPDGAKSWRPDCAAYDWIGFNPDKGLGIFSFGDLALTRHPSYLDAFALYLPVTVTGWCRFNLLGLWAADPRRIPPCATTAGATTTDVL